LTADGLPVGLELDGPSGTDLRLLAISHAIETVLPAAAAPAAALIRSTRAVVPAQRSCEAPAGVVGRDTAQLDQ
jgi:hypothetical protein